MGQRLVMHIMKETKELACSYYHWSGYTSSTTEILTYIVETHLDLDKELNLSDLELAIFLLEETGAGLSDESIDYISKSKLPINPDLRNRRAIDRNNGIIDIDPKEIERISFWAEADAYYDIKTGEISIAAFYVLNPDAFEDIYDSRFPELPTTNIKPRNGNVGLYTFQTIYDLKYFIGILPCATEDGYAITPIE